MLTKAPRKSPQRHSRDETATATKPIEVPAQPWWFSWTTAASGLLGALLLWAAFPPLNLPLLAWLAPLPWLWLVRLPKLPGWRPYLVLYAAGSLHWLLMLQGIRLAHPALYGGWLALSLYLAVYLPVFIGLTRVAVHRLNVSVIVASPVVWVGLELLRGHLVTGFSNGLLAHTQAELPLLIQIADLAGGYALSFLIMLVGACLAQLWMPRTRVAWWPILPMAATLAGTITYGYWRLSQQPSSEPTCNVALIQGSLDTTFGVDRVVETMEHYRRHTDRAVAERVDLDLVIWPESSFQIAERLIEEPLAPSPGEPITADEMRGYLSEAQTQFARLIAGEAARANSRTAANRETRLLLNTTTLEHGSGTTRMYNAALVADRNGRIVSRYYKTHPVMFGEYIPFGEWIPWLYRITPLGMGLSRGSGPEVFTAGGLALAPNICFESTVPHLVRGQLGELARRGTPADVIVNISNDGWFWGSAILDLHFRSNIFRAVENRKPLLVAANTGISAWIDGNGIVRQRAAKRRAEVLFAAVQADRRTSPYHILGDWPAWLCAAACIGLAIIGLRRPVSE